MSGPYSNLQDAISAAESSNSLGPLSEFASQFSATASGPNGILFSGKTLGESGDQVANTIASQTQSNVITNTDLGKVLINEEFQEAVTTVLQNQENRDTHPFSKLFLVQLHSPQTA